MSEFLMIFGMACVFGWACWQGGYAQGRMSLYRERDISALDSATPEDAARQTP